MEVLGGAILALESYGYPINTADAIGKGVGAGTVGNYPGGYNWLMRDIGFDPVEIKKGARMLADEHHVQRVTSINEFARYGPKEH